jgi:hypothetical protein
MLEVYTIYDRMNIIICNCTYNTLLILYINQYKPLLSMAILCIIILYSLIIMLYYIRNKLLDALKDDTLSYSEFISCNAVFYTLAKNIQLTIISQLWNRVRQLPDLDVYINSRLNLEVSNVSYIVRVAFDVNDSSVYSQL